MLLRPGSSKAALLGLDNLFLASLFAGFVRSVPHLSADEAAALQPPRSAALLVEDFYYIIYWKSTKNHQKPIRTNNYKKAKKKL